ncbi:MAG: NTP pyrophosphohydrolase [Opitutales bacterium]|nr:NTP pyrophosphohydrolase [Opitutales bacterium]|tara:strand:- start:103 stop:471 length:369 start_codon:yes stop_codon:yes gene_type:complete
MNTDTDTTLRELKERIRAFSQARDWEQFHVPKNLAMALAAEVGELMESFLWIDAEESRLLCDDPVKRAEVEEELADVLIYTLRFADVAGLDATKAIMKKMARNEERYPVEKAKGSSAKYDEL